MSDLKRFMVRDVGAALAVLSIYFLMLLAPLHQAAASQDHFADLGYRTIGALSICEAISAADAAEDAPSVCPVAAIGKAQVLGPDVVVDAAAPAIERTARFLVRSSALYHPFDVNFQAAPRAPPAVV